MTQHATFESNLILLGDLNTISKKEDRTSGTLDPVTENVLAMKSNLAVTDVWSALNNTEKGFTWINRLILAIVAALII